MLLAVAMVVCGSAAHAQQQASEVRYYEPVTVLSGAGEGGAQGALELGSSLSLQALGQRFDLDIEPNHKFMSGGSTTWVGAGAAAGRATSLQLYKGRLRGNKNSWVRLGIIDGQLHGMIWTPDEIYVFQPLSDFVPGASSTETVAYRGSDVDPTGMQAATCGVEGELAEHMGVPEELIDQREDDGGSAEGTQLMEAGIVLVADYEYYSEAAHGAQSDAQLRFLLSLVDAIYEREVNVSLGVANTIIFTDINDPFTGGSPIDAGTLLDQITSFRGVAKYCQKSGNLQSCSNDAACGTGGPCVNNLAFGSDLAHLVTNRDLNGSTIGIAWIGAVCSQSHGTGLSQDYSSSTFTMSLLLAHEMGHNFSASHDSTSNPCGDPPPRYIMQPCLSGNVVDQFSTASKNQIIPYTQNLGCLSPAGTPLPTGTPTSTFTPAPPTATPTRTPTRTATRTSTFTQTRTPTRTGTFTPTRTHTRTFTATRTATNSPLPTATFTATPPNWPGAFSGLSLWLDAKQLTGVANGAALSSWPDLSGTAHHASQATTTNRPTYQATALNGQPAIRFDGSNDYMSIAGTVISGSQARTVFVVGRPTVIGNRGFVDLGNGTATGRAFMLSPEYGVRVGSGSAIFNQAATTNTSALYVVQLNGTTTSALSAWVNGTSLGTSSVTNVTVSTTGSGLVGGYAAAPGGSTSFAGDIAEIVVYNRALSLTERQTLEQYLTGKYGITWQGGSVPTATSTPIPATSTPTNTATPFVPPTPTNTGPLPATATPTSTATSAPPTATFTPGAGPQGIANLVLWLDASQLTGLGNGAQVSTWTDASGQGHHGTQANATNRPTYQGSALNGEPALRFDGTNDYLSLAGTIVSGAQARTVFFVARPNTTGNQGIVDLGNGSTTGGGFQISSEYAVRIMGASRIWAPAASTTTPTLGVVQLTGSTTSTLNLWIDGVARTATSTTSATVQTAGSGTVGSWTAGPVGANNFNGDIAEIIVYSRVLNTSERQTVEQYLNGKYALGVLSSPSEIAGLQLWLDAGELTGLSAGAAVSSWTDGSGVGHDATQSATASLPTFQPTALNGFPAVRFDGNDDYLALNGAVVSGNQSRTVVWVGRPTIVGNRGIIDLGHGGTTGGAFMVTPENAVRVSGGNRVWSTSASTSTPSIGVVTFSGSSTNDLSAWLNGTALGVSGTAAATVQTSGGATIGAWTSSPAGGNNFAGDLAEILVYDRALSTVERQDLEQLLAAKYGL